MRSLLCVLAVLWAVSDSFQLGLPRRMHGIERVFSGEGEAEMTDEELIAAKLLQWKVLKEEGTLQKLSSATLLTEEDVMEFEIEADRVLKSKGVKLLLRQPTTVGAADQRKAATLKMITSLDEKVTVSVKDDAKLYNILVEIRDKEIVEDCEPIIEKIVDAFAKLPTSKRLLPSLRMCLEWVDDDLVDLDAAFWEMWMRKLAVNMNINIDVDTNDTLFEDVLNLLINHDAVRSDEVKIIRFLFHMKRLGILQLQPLLVEICSDISLFSIESLNDLLKALGLAGYRNDAFALFDLMQASRRLQQRPNAETVEYLVGGLLLPQVAEETATSMKDLPSIYAPSSNSSTPLPSLLTRKMSPGKKKKVLDVDEEKEIVPEVILVGRSNVGKSSLTNLLLNRKKLASVSATPGHTQAFHFFSLTRRAQQTRDILPQEHVASSEAHTMLDAQRRNAQRRRRLFRVVDVPGLGYVADSVSQNMQTSWRSLLLRYLAVRANCVLVLHLLDARHKPSQTDAEIIELIRRAQETRAQHTADSSAQHDKTSGLKSEVLPPPPPFAYCAVFTKVDKSKGPQHMRELVRQRQADLQRLWRSPSMTQSPADKTYEDNHDENVVEDSFLHSSKDALEDETLQLHTVQDEGDNDQDISVIATSALDKTGIDDLWKHLLRYI